MFDPSQLHDNRQGGDDDDDGGNGDEFEQHALNPDGFVQRRLDNAIQYVRFGVLTGYRAPVSSSSSSSSFHRISTVYDYQDALQRMAHREQQQQQSRPVPGSFAVPSTI